MSRLALAAVLFASALPAHALVITIDDFVTPQTVSLSTAAPVSGGNVANPTATALGGERDLWVTKTAGAVGPAIVADINPFGQDLMRFDEGAGVRGSARVTWDGVDGNANAVAYTGLGGVDFGLASAGRLELLVSFNNIAGPIDFVIYDGTDATGTRRATGTVALPAGIDIDVTTDPAQLFALNFSDMTLLGGATNSMFHTVGAITMTINATAVGQGGRDVNLDLLRAVITVPVPGPLLLMLPVLGLLLVPRIGRASRGVAA